MKPHFDELLAWTVGRPMARRVGDTLPADRDRHMCDCFYGEPLLGVVILASARMIRQIRVFNAHVTREHLVERSQ
jgi:hypothetical protein